VIKMTTSYALQVGKWFDKLQKGFSSYMPQGTPDINALAREGASDSLLQAVAFTTYQGVMNSMGSRQSSEKPTKHYRLVETRLPDGSYYITDLNGGGQIKALRRKRGNSFYYNKSGPEDLIIARFGRAELGGLAKDLEDDDLDHAVRAA
jgi:hypothetical protein